MVFKAHFTALQHGKKENHKPKEVYLKSVSCLDQRNFAMRDFLSRGRENNSLNKPEPVNRYEILWGQSFTQD